MNTDTHVPQQCNQPKRNPFGKTTLYIILFAFTLVFISPLLFIFNNSFKGRFFISDAPFAPPPNEYRSSLDSCFSGLKTTNFFVAAGWSFFVMVGSVIVIVFFYAMTTYYITRVKTKWTNALYLLFVFSMVVPSQVVMFPTVKLADTLNLNSPLDMILLYLGFGSGLSVFILSGFIKSIPIEIEEASMIDDCDPLQNYFRIVMPIFKPVVITVAILGAMWVWNDYLLLYLAIGLSTPYKTIPVIVQQLVGSHGSNDIGVLVAILILVIIPIVIFYLFSQKYIVEGVVTGAAKG